MNGSLKTPRRLNWFSVRNLYAIPSSSRVGARRLLTQMNGSRGSAGSEGRFTLTQFLLTQRWRPHTWLPPAPAQSSCCTRNTLEFCFLFHPGSWSGAWGFAHNWRNPETLAGECSCLFPTLARGKATSSHGGGNMYNLQHSNVHVASLLPRLPG